jgi:hypothetical protein
MLTNHSVFANEGESGKGLGFCIDESEDGLGMTLKQRNQFKVMIS